MFIDVINSGGIYMSNNERRKYDNKDDPEPEAFSRRGIDQEEIISRKRLYQMFSKNYEKLNKIQQDLNNGLKKEVRKLSKEQPKIKTQISKLHNKIDNIRSEKAGRNKHRENLGWYLSVILSIITILSLTGVI